MDKRHNVVYIIVVDHKSALIDTHLIEQILNNSDKKYSDFLDLFNNTQLSIQIVPLVIGSQIIRARHSETNQTLSEFKDFKYPPASNGFSRVGIPGHIWFYASENYETCILEMLPAWMHEYKLGSEIKVTFGYWQVRERLNLLLLPDFSLKSKVSRKARLDEFYSDEEKKTWQQIDKYFYQTTNFQSDVYQLSSAVVSSMLLRLEIENTEIDGVLFPSAQQGEYYNIALTKKSIDDQKLFLTRAVEGIFKKSEHFNQNGLPSYSGPDNTREGYFNHEKQSISWQINDP